ncbi:major facilitator superfamily domain-containing protein [Rhodocollybia butyracea]|uniref:Major facilitator superfamily domain-containing protein n=1 Tax=Rhodocollybia butyracea TaxID=206335 RepID=A0A9P5PPX9_9AGAR|nr:major facilitator superfamily domain-containing protein [Rhodocollybia butyracea]
MALPKLSYFPSSTAYSSFDPYASLDHPLEEALEPLVFPSPCASTISPGMEKSSVGVIFNDFKDGERPSLWSKSSLPSPIDDIPDEGIQAWTVLFGVICIAFTTSGYMSTWGVFQAYYEGSLLQDSSRSTIAWIGSIQQSFLYIPTLIFTRLLDAGYFRTTLSTASVVFVVATVLVAQCHVYWQFLICQGLVTGIAAGAFSGPVTAVLSQWFSRRRGLALGMYAAGSSLGGTVLPITAKLLLPRIGFVMILILLCSKWTVRAVALIIMVGLTLGNLTIKQRRPLLVNKSRFHLSSISWSKIYVVYCCAVFSIYLGYYTFTTYVAASSITIGLSIGFSFYLLSICNASSGLSRIASGLIADKTGAINLMIPITTLSAAVYFAWPFIRSEAVLVFLSIAYGTSIGPFASLVSSPVLDIGEKDQTGNRIGVLLSVAGIAMLLGTPISGAIDKSWGPIAMGVYAGSMMLFGVILMIIVRYWSKKEHTRSLRQQKLAYQDSPEKRLSVLYKIDPIRFSLLGYSTLPQQEESITEYSQLLE